MAVVSATCLEDDGELLRHAIAKSIEDTEDLDHGGDGRTMSPYGLGGLYHEKQVGNLCAVHTVNNLLQGPLFEAEDFFEIARELDAKERKIMDGMDIDSTGNAQADGFFNVQVIKIVMQRMGYTMERISGEHTKDSLKNTAAEKGYVLNKEKHWFALRRLGAQDWFDLNSCKKVPRHYTNADLVHHIDEAMREKYEVFVVRGGFPRTPIEDDSKALLEAVKACGRASQGHALFAAADDDLATAAPSTKQVSTSSLFDDDGAPAPGLKAFAPKAKRRRRKCVRCGASRLITAFEQCKRCYQKAWRKTRREKLHRLLALNQALINAGS